ncbi:MAG TPA: 1,4-beta-xylanase, partial [Rikenellaceae bacterium]|nr:1,4-beta-xylanase [Rikenellaceae bacterium]
MKKTTIIAAIVTALVTLVCFGCADKNDGRWSKHKAGEWYVEQGWISGCDFIPSYAVNQLEMWQAETFDPEVIERELDWAERLG